MCGINHPTRPLPAHRITLSGASIVAAETVTSVTADASKWDTLGCDGGCDASLTRVGALHAVVDDKNRTRQLASVSLALASSLKRKTCAGGGGNHDSNRL